MKSVKAIQKLKILANRISLLLRLPSKQKQEESHESAQKNSKNFLEQQGSVAYQVIGDRIGCILPIFKDLDNNLERSQLKIDFKVYASLTVFVAVLSSVATLVVVSLLSLLIFRTPLLAACLFGVGGGMLAGALSTIGLYVYPLYHADKLKRGLDDELPFTTGYMAILSSAGVSPEKIFTTLSSLQAPLAISQEAKDIVRDVNLFGSDIISALEKCSKRTPSKRLQETLEGVISTIHSGGNLSAFLRGKTKEYMKLKRMDLKKYSDTLSILSEFYVTLLLTGPLLLVIMLSVMAMLGGGNLGILSPDLLLSLLTYIGLPLGAIMFLIILDGTSPKW
jgi:flagellar protein FlaJ